MVREGGGVRLARLVLAVALLVPSLLLLAGCDGAFTLPARKPAIRPPGIIKAGELRAAIDLDYPPFGGVEERTQAGLDIDVAAALADRLGLKLVIVDAKPADANKLLADDKVDIVLGGLTLDQALTDDVAFAGAYADAAPVLFSSKPDTVSIDALGAKPIAVQQNSPAFWSLSELYGPDLVRTTPTLREAMQVAESGQVDYVAGDSIVGSYMLRDFARLRLVGQIAPATPVGVGASKENPELENAVRTTLDKLAAEGVLDTLRRKWIGDVPRLEGASEESTSP